ncbi:hypothetical protein ABB37_00906 [Leptomonas pyrrhocoris]|uniref:TROVE domain-containing protein n=1 Tax=Leptomonas pyrrhocoris TaxID=157538 RepID=A0A0N0VHY5_LEPPY|nr:hypothetical protein ABB37_00906 [Leptomonas pyrrhocoris]KPA86858.1 hypothetical protein ABB37_00906 [Leptomonas pyrrhocoris]|eukprot:XP_015665297.1 hypothetical protein ABB37_00906 [Leptomonas pyrrhocoris]
MDFFYAANAADLTPLKTELVDFVSSCLMKEPPYEAIRPDQLSRHHNASRKRETPEAPQHLPQEEKPPVSDGVATVAHMRELVHLISRQDGEFVLKLALYTRRTLHLRSSPNYLVALCAREPNCIPFLQPYMEKIVMIPPDWLAIANFAYFYDCDAAHDFSCFRAPYTEDEDGEAEGDTVSQVSAGLVRSPATVMHRSVSSKDSPAGRTTPSWTSREARPPTRGEKSERKRRKSKKTPTSTAADPTRSYLPTALRTSLVHCFATFTPFSMSKYDNEAAEHRAHRKARQRLQKQQAHDEDAERSGSESAEDSSSDSDDENVKAEGMGDIAASAHAARRQRRATFTYKLLIRVLHITQPAFLVCCILGKQYPSSEEAFMQMGLHRTDPTWMPAADLARKVLPSKPQNRPKKAATREETAESDVAENTEAARQPYCIFHPTLSGTRMRLPVVQTWETLLSKEGNKGKVWDFLIASRAVGYMALLRNLRNILTRTCSAATHKLVLEKLVDEQQVAMSQQLPYRFYSAYVAVKEVREMAVLLAYQRPASRPKAQPGGRGSRSGRGNLRGGRGNMRGGRRGRGAAAGTVVEGNEFDERVRRAHASFEAPAASLKFLHRYLDLYTAAVDSAVNTAARLNVIPMKGTSVVILCVTQALMECMTATGAAVETASIQRKIDVAALLIAMLMRSCEQCVVLLYCYDEYVVFREDDYANTATEADLSAAANANEEAHKNSGSSSNSNGDWRGSDSALDDGNTNFESRSSDTSDTDPLENTCTLQTPHRLSFMKLVDALVLASTQLLTRKTDSEAAVQRCTCVATSFDMFSEGSGAQFPYAFLDEVIERSMRVESLLVFDEGTHRTYAQMNPNAPAFGDLPTYLSRMRRTGSPDLVYVGVNLKAASPLSSQRALSGGAAQVALQRAAVKDRFRHHNDLLLTGFSDAILRLVAERVGGGALAVIERAAETYEVARFSARANHEALAERARALKLISALREGNYDAAGAAAAGRGSPPVTPPPSAEANAAVDDSVNRKDTPPSHPPPSAFALPHKDPAMLSAAAAAATTTVTLPSFDALGKVVTSAAWEVDWGPRSRSSERQLQQLTGSSAGLSSCSSPTSLVAPSAAGAESLATSGPAALPSIRRLLSKRSIVEAEASEVWSRTGGVFSSAAEDASPSENHVTGGGVVADVEEAAWLAPQGKQVSSIYHPRPFISLVKLLSASSERSAFTPADGGVDDRVKGAAARTTVGRCRRTAHVPSRSATPSPSTTAAQTTPQKAAQRRDKHVRGCASSVSPTPAFSTASSRHRKGTKMHAVFPCTQLGVVRRLLTSYRICRFFISSTFVDMNNERNAITLDVFPRLRRWAAEVGLKVTLLEVDLRWGIPAVATTRNLSTSVCLNEVSRCSPFFIGMIGARYGSCPPTPLQLVVDEDVEASDYGWMTELTHPHVSVTELEMRHAMYNTRRRLGYDDTATALFFARDFDHLMSTFSPADVAARRVYEADSPTATQAISALKQRIVGTGCALTIYRAAYNQSNKKSLTVESAAVVTNSIRPDGVGDVSEGKYSSITSGSGGGGGDRVRTAQQSSTRAMLEDDLGRWAVRDGRALDAVGPTAHTTERNGENADSLWSLVTTRISDTEESRPLTSTDVPLDMSDFSAKVFVALQDVIRRICGVHTGDTNRAEADSEAVTQRGEVKTRRTEEAAPRHTNGTPSEDKANVVEVASPTSPTAVNAPDLYGTLIVAQSEYARKLSALYAAPRGLLEQLSSFAVAGTLHTSAVSSSPLRPSPLSTEAATVRDRATSPSTLAGERTTTDSSQDNGALTTDEQRGSLTTRNGSVSHHGRGSNGLRKASAHSVGSASSILLVEGGDGDGKSSALAALMERMLLPMHKAAPIAEARPFLFYSTQAGDDSVRSLLLFLATTYRALFHLYAEVSVQESDSIEQLLLMLDQAYATVHRRYEASATGSAGGTAAAGPAALVVILDGLDKSSESVELVSLLGTILHPLAAPHIRFIVSACPRSQLASALRTRTPAARVVPLPLLSEGERAQLVRLHLAAYGKLLEESFSADELKTLLRKAGAGRPSRLISAITYLRLFSTFDTLREDIRALPATSTQLYVKFFHQLQTRFDGPTTRLVLTLLLLRHPVGGVMEYNLYRLVSNVAVASRLVALLRGICVDSHHGRLFITSAAFVTAVARTYLPYASDWQSAQERVLVAELRYQPVDMTMDAQEVRQALCRTRESIERNASTPLASCLFYPERYSPRELLGVLQGSVQASRLDITATLVCYLPFLECVMVSRRMLSQLIGLLSSTMHATKRLDDTVTPVVAVAGAVDGDVDLINGGDAVESEGNVFSGGSVPLQWHHYRNEVRRIGNALEFLQTHYHILLRQPSLLRQCVWNALSRGSCISVYDTASTALMRSTALQKAPLSSRVAENDEIPKEPLHDTGLHPSAGSTAVSNTKTDVKDAAALWVHWLNLRQHGGETRVLLTTASPLAIRCMALSPDEAEVALGGDDGFVRRVRTSDEEDALLTSQQSGLEKAGGGAGAGGTGGDRSRLGSMLRHESAVAAVRYVPPQTHGGPASGFTGRSVGSGGFAAFSASSSSSPTPQLLVSGCVRGIVYVWNLEDNSLLQRGTGHLRSISGLVCHPLQPMLLCSGSHDSYVMLWNLCGSPSQLSEEVSTAIARRLPKYPANSPERRRQQQQQRRMMSSDQNGSESEGRGAAAVYQSSLAARATAARPAYLTPLIAFHKERQHRGPVACVDFHCTGDIMASGSWDGALLLYNTRALCTPPPVLPCIPPPPRGSASGQAAAVKKPMKWRVRHGAEYQRVAFRTMEFDLKSPVRSLSFTNSLAVTCIVGCHNGAIFIVDYASGSVVARWTSLHTAPITRVLASPDGRCVASADERGVVRLTYMGISGTVFATLNGHQGAVTGLCFRAPFESAAEVLEAPQLILLTTGEDRTLQAWRVNSSSGPDVKSSTQCLTTSHSTAVTAVATSADGLKLVTGSADGTAIVFCLSEEGGVGGGWTSGGHNDATTTTTTGTSSDHAVFTNSLRTLAAYKNTAALLQSSAARPMTPSFVLRHDDCRITCITFALQDTKIVVGVVFGLVYVWSAAPGLNRIEGRLLLRVQVPEHGLYPVVSFNVQESVAAAAASHWSSELSPEVFTSLSVRRCTAESSSSSLALPFFTSAATSSPYDTADDSRTAHVTAICANGDVAVVKLLSEAASRVMVADQDRRRHQRRLRHRSSNSFSLRAGSLSNSGGGLALFEGDRLYSSDVDMLSQTVPYPTTNQPAPAAPLPQPWRTLKSQTREGPMAQPSVILEVATTLAPHPDPSIFAKRQRAAHRELLDRRAMKLQHLLARCHVNEMELRESFQLDLHRHRLQWADVEAAEEITAVVWLTEGVGGTAAQHPPQQQPLEGMKASSGEGRGGDGESRHRKLALVVTQRKLFLMLSSGSESAVSGGLNIRISRQTPDAALVLKNAEQMPEEGVIVARASDSDKEEENATWSVGAPCLQTDLAQGAAVITHDHLREAEVDVDYLLSEEEYFTAASTAMLVATITSTSTTATSAERNVSCGVASTAHISSGAAAQNAEAAATNTDRKRDATAQLSPLTSAFVVALTTSRGEVLLLRIHVPHLHRRDAPRRSSPPRTSSSKYREESGLRGSTAATALELRTHVLPLVQVHLCQRLSFTKVSAADAMGESGTAASGSAAPQRMSVTPLVTTVQLSVLPNELAAALPPCPPSPALESGKATAAAASLQMVNANTVDKVVLAAGCSDGSARVWMVPTSPLAVRGGRGSRTPILTSSGDFTDGPSAASSSLSDVPVGCFFCSSAVNVTSPLLQVVSTAQERHKGWMRRSATSAPLPLPPLQQPRWVVGDALGNVYQLQLERDAPGGAATALLRCSAAPERSSTAALYGKTQVIDDDDDSKRRALLSRIMTAGGAELRPWVSSLQKLVGMMEHLPPTAVLQALTTSSSSTNEMDAGVAGNGGSRDDYDGGGGGGGGGGVGASWSMGASQTPADWLTSVDFSAPVSATLLKRSRVTPSSTFTSSNGTSAAHAAHERTGALPSVSSSADQIPHCLPAQEWLILPRLPTALHTTPFTSPDSFAALTSGPQQSLLRTADEAQDSFNVHGLALNVLPAPSAALPSFGSSPPRQQPPQRSSSARRTSNDDGDAALHADFVTPLSDLLTAYRRNGQEGEEGKTVEGEMTRLSTMLRGSSTSNSSHSKSCTTSPFLAARLVPHTAGGKAAQTSHVRTPEDTVPSAAKKKLSELDISRSAATSVKPFVRFELTPPPPLVSLSSGATRSEAAAALHRDAAVPPFTSVPIEKGSNGVHAEGRDGEGEDEEEEEYFHILYKSGPPPPVSPGVVNSAEMKRKWLLRQQAVLKEATRVQQYNKQARAALQAYQQRVASAVGM